MGTTRLAQDFDSTLQTLEGLSTAEQCGDIKEVGTLSSTDECQTEAVHHRTEAIALLLDPSLDDLFGRFAGEIFRLGGEECSELGELGCAVFLPTLLHGLLIVSRGSGEEVSDLLLKLGERLSTLLRQGDGASYIVCIEGDACSSRLGRRRAARRSLLEVWI